MPSSPGDRLSNLSVQSHSVFSMGSSSRVPSEAGQSFCGEFDPDAEDFVPLEPVEIEPQQRDVIASSIASGLENTVKSSSATNLPFEAPKVRVEALSWIDPRHQDRKNIHVTLKVKKSQLGHLMQCLQHNKEDLCKDMEANLTKQKVISPIIDEFEDDDDFPEDDKPPLVFLRMITADALKVERLRFNESKRASLNRDVALLQHEPAEVVKKKFNASAKKGIKELKRLKLVDGSPKSIADWLFDTEGISTRRVGEYLGSPNPENNAALQEYCMRFNFKDKFLVDAIRIFLVKFRLPGEALQVDRIMQALARAYTKANGLSEDSKGESEDDVEKETNWNQFPSEDAVFMLAFSIIMCNTSVHSREIKNERDRMTEDGFLRLTEECDGKKMDKNVLRRLYKEVKDNEIKMNEGDMYEKEISTYIAPKKSGWLEKKGGYLIWHRYWFILTNGCLYYFLGPNDNDPRCIIELTGGTLVDENDGGKKRGKHNYFRIEHPKFFKSLKMEKSPPEVGKNKTFTFRIEDDNEYREWKLKLREEFTVNKIEINAKKPVPHVGDPDLCGWALKRGQLNTNFQRRFFALYRKAPARIYYFANERQARLQFADRNDRSKGFVELRGNIENPTTVQKGENKTIKITTADRVWVFMAADSSSSFLSSFRGNSMFRSSNAPPRDSLASAPRDSLGISKMASLRDSDHSLVSGTSGVSGVSGTLSSDPSFRDSSRLSMGVGESLAPIQAQMAHTQDDWFNYIEELLEEQKKNASLGQAGGEMANARDELEKEAVFENALETAEDNVADATL